MSGQAMAIALAAVLTFYVGSEVVKGAKWVGHEAKKAGHAIVHVIKKIPHG